MSKFAVTLDEHTYTIDVRPHPTNPTQFIAVIDQQEIVVSLPAPPPPPPAGAMIVGNRPYELEFEPSLHWLQWHGGRNHLEIHDLETSVVRPVSGDGRVKAPIPGLITKVMVAAEETVTIGQPLVILEAMKMGNEIRSPRAGVVKQVAVKPGQSVPQNTLLIEIV